MEIAFNAFVTLFVVVEPLVLAPIVQFVIDGLQANITGRRLYSRSCRVHP
jgi:hypothetical protein